jgi:serine/threonine-protein kinase
MGVVYRAVDTKLGRSVALKFLNSADEMQGEARARFLREARAASALDHPNIGAIYGIEESDSGELCIVMAYYDGETVAERITRGRIPVSEALRIAIAVADGLSEAHSYGIIHRDIKPSNILLTRNGGVKVVDFGLATCATGEGDITRPQAVIGTAAYMSPEQARGEHVDARTDVWSLGSVLYEMLSGGRPFNGGSTYSLLRALVSEAPRPLDIGHPELERVVMKALAKKASARYASMQHFANDLRRIAAAVHRYSSHPTVGMVVPPRSKRAGKCKLWAIAAVCLLAVCGVLLLLTPWRFGSGQPVGLAILPFSSAQQDPAAAALARGFAEALSARIAVLERFQNKLSVIPNGELAAKGITDAGGAQRLTGATLAVTGYVRRGTDGSLFLDLELQDKRGAVPVRWTVQDRNGDAFALEHRAAAQICALLDVEASPQAAASERSAEAAKAYEEYLRGLGYLQRWDKPGNLENALAAFTRSTATDPGFAPAYVGLAEASRTRFRAESEAASIQHALNYARQAVRLDDTLADAHVVLGRTLQDMAQRDLALLEFRRALEIDERNSSALLGMARANEDLGKTAEAENVYKRAVALSPYSWPAQNNLANFFMRRQRYREAEAQFRRAMLVTPDNPALLSNLGIVLVRQRRMAEAVEMFRRSIQLGPSYAVYVNLGNLHYRVGEFREAADAYESALRMNSTDFRIWGTKAQALRFARRNAADAAAAYREAIRLAEQASAGSAAADARTFSLLGIYYARVGDSSNAVRRIQAALRRANGDKDVFVDAATVYETLGDRQTAARWARSALQQGYSWEDLRRDPDLQHLVRSGAVQKL